MAVDDLGNALCYHPLGSGRAGFASRRRLDLYQVLETGFTRARHEPAIGATTATRLVGLRRCLAVLGSIDDQHSRIWLHRTKTSANGPSGGRSLHLIEEWIVAASIENDK